MARSRPRRWISASAGDALALPDGLTLDAEGRPLIAAHAAGAELQEPGGGSAGQ
ncbi:hypothetical protein [Streptomyces crystallinus]|uniref:Uncharacterized protein n=1 Tax=Streptomyces crystallinus TaxID=68191 RepID=A0ABN1FDN5_9ACTN